MSVVPATLERLLKSPSLPSVPAVALKLLELTRDPDSGTRDIINTIKSDPALAARILKSANSSYFSFRSEVRTLEQAVPLIGRTAITSLALSFSLAQDAMAEGALAKHYHRFWLQSLVQASAAETLAHFGRKGLGSELFMTGLLIDLGQLALLRVLKSEYVPVLEEVEQTGRPLVEVERERLGCDHAIAGAALMVHWKLPDIIKQATLLHHAGPEALPEDRNIAELVEAMMVTAAVGDYFCGKKQGEGISYLRTLTSRFFNMSEESLSGYLAKTEARIKEAADLLNTNTDDLPSAGDLMAQAAEQIAELTTRQAAEQQDFTIQHQQVEQQRMELESQNERLRQQVFCDPLTGIYNRRYFDEAIASEVKRTCRRGSPLAVIFVDADHFKRVNDTYGHKFGDAVLVRIAECMQRCIRQSDVVARYGGEEFVVLAMDTTEAGLRTLAERIRADIEATDIRCNDQPVRITVSVGGATMIPRATDTNVETRLIEAADAAMYESKRRGRNCVTIHSMSSDLERRVALLSPKFRFSDWLAERNLIGVDKLHEFVQKARPDQVHIGELAFRRGWLDLNKLQQVLETQGSSNELFGAIAHRLGFISIPQLALLLANKTEDTKKLAVQLVEAGILSQGELQTLLECFEADCETLLAEKADVIAEPAVVAR